MIVNKKMGISLTLAAFLALNMTGCGSSDDNSDVAQGTPVDVVVERGKVFDADVKDSSNPPLVAQEKSGENVYTFAKAPTYPITVSGGWIDVNNNGVKDTGDVDLDIIMKSYSTVVTPVTTFIADANATVREQKLNELLSQLNDSGVGKDINITVEDLLKVPSEAPRDVFVLANAIYKDMKENNVQVPTIDAVLSQFGTLDSSLGDNATAQELEENVMTTLENMGLIEFITSSTTDENTDTTSPTDTALDVSGYGTVVIYKNVSDLMVDTLTQGVSNYDGFGIEVVSGNTNCTDIGFSGDPIVSNNAGVASRYYTLDYTHSCMETDYSGVSYASGSSTVLVHYNVQSSGENTDVTPPADTTPPAEENTDTTSAPVAGNTDTNLDMSGYSAVVIYKNVSDLVLDGLTQAFANNNGYGTEAVSSNTSCTDLGFSGNPVVSNNAGVDSSVYYSSDYARSCMEVDYSGVSYASGSSTALVHYNVQ